MSYALEFCRKLRNAFFTFKRSFTFRSFDEAFEILRNLATFFLALTYLRRD